ncbi:hypothetical protein [Mucilaginibacter sp. dw_454]|uniref:hypothetical protein n=1 Tax=Mucilaginibacter sp. dw_454 TaxID=2720079 RepID=UPI001BD2747C|nr:hypothetical protein [Mucilaginibacter sp. dw_454]
MRKSILYLLVAVCFTVGLQSCTNSKGTKANDQIDKDIRQQIAEVNKKLFEGITTGNVQAVKDLMSPELLKNAGSQIDTIVTRCSKRYPAKSFELLDEYYTKGMAKKSEDSIKSDKGSVNDYNIGFRVSNDEMYTSLMVTKGLTINGLIFAVYGKYGNDWKVAILQMGDYSIMGKTAEDYYKEAQELHAKGSLVDATNLMIITSQLVSPGGTYFSYRNVSQMKIFFSTTIDVANATYQLPIIVKQVKTEPQIFSISPQVIEEVGHEGIYPVIKYRSTIKLEDTAALKAENDAMQQAIGTIFNGIDQNNQYIMYEAYNQMPDGKSSPRHYGFIQKLK